MATNKRSGNRGRGGRNNNPDGLNQYSGLTGRARENPLAAAAAVGGAVAAGVFLWSRRNQISEQIGNLSDQIGDWRDGMMSDSDLDGVDGGAGTDAGTSFVARPAGRGNRRTQAELAEEALTLKQTGQTA